MSKAVGVVIDGETEWHAPSSGVSDYDTLCNLDSRDPAIGHEGVVEPKRGQKITCAICKTIWRNVIDMKLRNSDFDV